MHVYNTLTRQLEEVEALEPGHLRLYTCGPTVYNFAHIGNFRAYAFEDLLRRTLKSCGWRVTQVMNLTDVDDKTIKGANAAGLPLAAYTAPFKQAFFEDLKTLNIEPAEHYPAATDYVPAMIRLVQTLLDKGHAYRSEDGSVYFSIATFKDYGKLAHLDMGGLRAGARVAQDEYEKENLADFALWKAWSAEDGPVAWDAPWGRGRPGWHIECSAMSQQLLGDSFDMHTGGVDNVFPHHEDEIAQSEAATGKPFVRYWLHCAHLIVDGRKMSKSLGNFHTLRDLLARGFTGREIRYVLLACHFRQALNFTFDALHAARAALARVDEFTTRLRELAGSAAAAPLPAWAAAAHTTFRAGLEEDLNISAALAALFDMLTLGNRQCDAGAVTPGAAAAVLALLADWDRVLGLLQAGAAAVDATVQGLLDQRAAARQAKDWATSDRLRQELAALGWDVRDGADGQKVRKR